MNLRVTTTLLVVTALGVASLAVSAVESSAFESSSTARQLRAPTPDGTNGYTTAPRCDRASRAASTKQARPQRVQLEGNSIAGEIRTCLGTILRRQNITIETVNPPGFLLCNVIPDIAAQVRDPATHPDAAVLFVFVAYDGRCGEPWHWPVDELVSIWREAGTHVYLVPSVPFVPGTKEADTLSPGPALEAEYYAQLARDDPEHITLLDAGTFIRDAAGNYRWRMPCLPAGEPGCNHKTNTVGVRYVDGFHFCTDPDFATHGCQGSQHKAGERRAAASVAAGLLSSLEARARPR